MRRKILREQSIFTSRSFTEPEVVKQELLAGVRAHLGPDYDLATHFTPRYRPWRQRIAFVPDADFFHTVKDGKASVVTDEIDTSLVAPRERKYETAGAASAAATGKLGDSSKAESQQKSA